jgi:hypothetical protein
VVSGVRPGWIAGPERSDVGSWPVDLERPRRLARTAALGSKAIAGLGAGAVVFVASKRPLDAEVGD